MAIKKYIAYGSNMNLEQMEQRCPGARVTGKGWLRDHRLFFAGRPDAAVASIEPAPGHAVPVVLWEITPKDEQPWTDMRAFLGSTASGHCLWRQTASRSAPWPM